MDNLEVAIETQRKVELFLLGLTFAILSVAINTFTYQSNWWLNVGEVVSWLVLFTGGFMGILRWRIMPDIYNRYHMKQRIEASANRGMTESEYSEGLRNLKWLEKKNKTRYDVFWLCFVFGLFIMVICRITPVVFRIIEPLCKK
jgi:hypothetical protein